MAMLLGTVSFLVTFGTHQNYHTEYIKFEVTDIEASYHAILDRPTMVRFMAVARCIYLLLKMSGPNALRGDLKKSYDCDWKAIEYASKYSPLLSNFLNQGWES